MKLILFNIFEKVERKFYNISNLFIAFAKVTRKFYKIMISSIYLLHWLTTLINYENNIKLCVSF